MNNKTKDAFTIVELLIVLAILSIILAIAVPGYIRAREEAHKNACIANLRQISTAIDQWIIEYKIAPGTAPSESDEDNIYSYLRGSRPKCQGGGVYTIHAVDSGESVTCSLSGQGHVL